MSGRQDCTEPAIRIVYTADPDGVLALTEQMRTAVFRLASWNPYSTLLATLRVRRRTMTEPIYLLVMVKNGTEAWYRLSKEEQDGLWAKVKEIDERAGGKWHLMCSSRWADEEVQAWGVLEYPSMEAYLRKVAELEELDWWRYFSVKTMLGTRVAVQKSGIA
jgi:hypothetical protein